MTVGAGNSAPWAAIFAASIAACSCGFHHTKYENPITMDTQQPDKLLYDKAIKDLQKGRYEMARLTLSTLINTYDTSEYLAKAYLAIADSWFKEGGVSGFAQAEQQYKDFELFYPTMPEAAEAQSKICKGHANADEQAGPGHQPDLAGGAGMQATGAAISQLQIRSGGRAVICATSTRPWRKARCVPATCTTTRDPARRRPIAMPGWWINIPCIAGRMRRLWKEADRLIW